MKRKDLSKSDKKTSKALARVAEHAIENGGMANVYLGSLRLPREFGKDQNLANETYAKIQSDFCKHVFRSTGFTPKYVALKGENNNNPEFSFCLFTQANAGLDKPEDFSEKGREIANSKCGQAGWGNGKLDLLELFRDGPRFILSSNPLELTPSNKEAVFEKLNRHLHDIGNPQHFHRKLFVSRTNH